MAMLIRFAPQRVGTEKYDEVIKRLEEAGGGAPQGRIYHVCFGEKNNLQVSEIWDSMENFEKFGQTLMPILQEAGIDPGTPEIVEVHNIIAG